jgi:hypothetical protein
MKRFAWSALSLGLVACLLSVTVNAATIGPAVNLNDLITNNGSVVAGDKTFDNFTYINNSGQMPLASEVNVTPILESGNYGIRITGAFADAQGGGLSDAVLTYRVTASPGRQIVDVHMAADVAIFGDNGFVGVTETFFPEDPLTIIDVFEVKPGFVQLTDGADLTAPVQSMHVQKDIIAFAGNGSAATLSIIDQTFSQIPEPGCGLLLLSGLVGMTLVRRRVS